MKKARRGMRTSRPGARCLMMASGGVCSTSPRPVVTWRTPVIAIAATVPLTSPRAKRLLTSSIAASLPAGTLYKPLLCLRPDVDLVGLGCQPLREEARHHAHLPDVRGAGLARLRLRVRFRLPKSDDDALAHVLICQHL